MTESVCDYFADPANLEVIRQMLEAGLDPEPPQAKRPGKLAGKTIVVTGTLENFSRQQARQAIRQAGAKSASSVSKKTDFVLAGKNAGSKLDKATKLGVEIITEEQFMEMIAE